MRKHLLIFVLLFLAIISNSQVSINLEITNNKYKQAYLCSVYGSKLNVEVKSVFVNNTVSFSFLPKVKGIYKIVFKDNSQLNVVVDNDKEIVLKAEYPKIAENIQVLNGDENKLFYSFVNYRTKQINALNVLIEKNNSTKNNKQISEKLGFFKGVFTYKIQKYADSLIAIDTTAFVAKAIKAMLIPDLNLYTIKHPNASKYRYDIEFLMLHFFDNIDFNETKLINTDIVYKIIKTYIEKIVLPRNIVGFNNANKFILEKVSNNLQFKKYVISELLNIYENTQMQEIYLNLYTNYVEKDTSIISKEQYTEVTKKVKIIRSLKRGSKIKDFKVIDTKGNESNILSLNSNFNILLFYKSDTKNIKSTIKQLNYINTKYKQKGINIIAISLDNDIEKWRKFITKNSFTYDNFIIKKGQEKIVNNNFNTWALPSIYIININGIVAAKPINVDYVKKECEKVFK